MAYGTLTSFDTLRSTYESVATFGEDNAFASIAAMLAAHNAIVNDILGDIAERSTDQLRRYGTADQMVMVKTDELGRPGPQRILPGVAVGFPLDSYQGSLQWTRKYLENASVAELAGQADAMRVADLVRWKLELQRAIFTPTNYNFDDYLVNRLQQIPLPVKAFLNADSAAIPAGPNGETFVGSTHTHYLATASFVQADLISALETVLEHYSNGDATIYINRAQETTIRGFANFVPYQAINVVGPTTANQIPMRNVLPVPIYNREIGEFNGAGVWVKPWIPSGYVFVFLRNQPRPLVVRTRNPTSGNLVLVAEDEKYPLRARTYEREFGVGVWNRTNGAVLYTGGGSYAAPTIAA